MLPGSVENTPGADNNSVKDSEGTIQQDKDTSKRVEDATKGGVYGTLGGRRLEGWPPEGSTERGSEPAQEQQRVLLGRC